MSIDVRVRNPQCEVRITSHRFGEIDIQTLRLCLIDVTTSMRMGDPSGSFQLTLSPVMPPGAALPRARWEDIIAPMDFVEIWMWEPPRTRRTVMRGFVDAIGETFAIQENPSRVVIVAGRNYGKLLQISKLWYLSNPSAGLRTQFMGQTLFEAWTDAYNKITSRNKDGSPGEPDQAPLAHAVATDGKLPATGPVFTPQEAMDVIYTGFYRPQEEVILSSFERNLLPRLNFQNEVDEDPDSTLVMFNPYTIPLSWQPYQDLWSMFHAYQHHPWRELFVQEGPMNPLLVYRKTPWLDESGDKLQAWGASVAVHTITLDRQCSWSIFRSDGDVKNFFFVLSGEMAGYTQAMRNFTGSFEGEATGMFDKNPYLIGSAVNSANSFQRFGVRLHEVWTPYLNFERAWSQEAIQHRIADVRRQGVTDCRLLVDALGHEERLERGTLVIPGDEQLDIGHYARLAAHPLASGPLYYCEGVQQHFRFGPGVEEGRWQTRLDVTRGRGFINRESGADAVVDMPGPHRLRPFRKTLGGFDEFPTEP